MTTREQKLIEALKQALVRIAHDMIGEAPSNNRETWLQNWRDQAIAVALGELKALASLSPDPIETSPKPLPEEIEAVLKSLRLWEGGMWSGHDVACRARLLIETFMETPPNNTMEALRRATGLHHLGEAGAAQDAKAAVLYFDTVADCIAFIDLASMEARR